MMPIFWGGGIEPLTGGALDAASAAGDARRARNDVMEAAGRIDRVLLACEAMWSLFREKLELTDEDLVRRMNDIDLSDGKLDGRVRKSAVACPKCGRTIARRFPSCMYCGQAVVHDPFSSGA